MTSFSKLKQKFSDNVDAADALSDISQYLAMIVTGTVIGGDVLTIPLIIYSSSKAAASVFKLLKVLIPSNDKEYISINHAERIDEIFYLLAQKAYLDSIKELENKLKSKHSFDKQKHKKLVKVLETAIISPERAEVKFEFGWTLESGPIQLFESYTSWLHPILLSLGANQKDSFNWLKAIEINARKKLFKELVNSKKNKWLFDYQLLNDHAKILDLLKGFINPSSIPKDKAWKNYLNDLKIKPSSPIWGEEEHGLGIDKLFVEPDYEYFRQLDTGALLLEPKVTLQNFLSGLISKRRPSTELIFIMGAPGIGKTSFMDIFCANLAATEKVHIVLVPAKKLDPKKSIFSEVQSYLSQIGHTAVADLLSSTSDCIIAIDGFDELAHATLSTLEDFFRNAHDLVRDRIGINLRIILSGRPTLFSLNDVSIPIGSHVTTLKPFNQDRVKEWSSNWQKAKMSSFNGHKYLLTKSKDINELAAQPMLLYLLAKMHDDDEPIPINLEESTKYSIYSKILDWICKRQEEKHITHITHSHLRRFLQVAGLATHQSGQRILHWNQFAVSLRNAGLAEDPKEIDSKAYSTILSFAFISIKERAWEFTHKSFGEALAAEAMGRVLSDISEQGKYGEEWRLPHQKAATIWIETFGPYFLTKDVLDFFKGWLQLNSKTYLINLITRLLNLYKVILSPSVSSYLANISNCFDRPIQMILGSSIRSWFSISNLALDIYLNIKKSKIKKQWSDSINIKDYRTGVYLSNLVSPLSVFESRLLFKNINEIMSGRPKHQSDFMNHLINLFLSYLYFNLNKHKFLKQNDLFHSFIYSTIGSKENFRKKNVFFSILEKRMLNSESIISISKDNKIDSFIQKTPIEKAFEELEGTIQHGYEPSIYEILSKQLAIKFNDSIISEDKLINEVLKQLKTKLSKTNVNFSATYPLYKYYKE
jgi:hypothetical protein